MKAFFSRKVPFYVVSAEEITDSDGFDAYPVEVSEELLENAQALRNVVSVMEDLFLEGSAPEECAQKEADYLEGLFNV